MIDLENIRQMMLGYFDNITAEIDCQHLSVALPSLQEEAYLSKVLPGRKILIDTPSSTYETSIEDLDIEDLDAILKAINFKPLYL